MSDAQTFIVSKFSPRRAIVTGAFAFSLAAHLFALSYLFQPAQAADKAEGDFYRVAFAAYDVRPTIIN